MSGVLGDGWPKEGEVVMCTVQKVEKFGAFLSLDEFGGKEGFIHISEVSTNWVKNIRDFFKEGRKVVAKVMRVDLSKAHIDLSLKRTTEQQKRYKLQQWKQKQKAEKLLELITKKLGKTPQEAKAEVVDRLLVSHPDLYSAFEEVVATGKEVLIRQNVPGEWVDALYPLLMQSIQIPSVSIDGQLSVQCYEPNGVEIVSNALAELAKPADGESDIKVSVQVIGPPRYRITVRAGDYKTAEGVLQKRVETIGARLKPFDHTFSFSRPAK